MCQWVKKGDLYITNCGRTSKIKGRGWEFCPYCGEVLDLDRRKYQRLYYKSHPEQFKEYYRKHNSEKV